MRSAMPGSVASRTCSRRRTPGARTPRRSRPGRRARRSAPAISSSSARVNTLPVGLCGVLTSTSRVRARERGRELVRVERPVRRAQRHDPPLGAGHGDAGRVGVVERLEAHDLVAGLAQREQRGGDRLRGARGDEHLAVGVELDGRGSAAGGRRSPRAAPGCPGPGGYWLWPARMAATAASSTSSGPSVSGKPCPRLSEPVRTASADISAKIVVPKPASFSDRRPRAPSAMGAEPTAWRSGRRGSAGRAPRATSSRMLAEGVVEV